MRPFTSPPKKFVAGRPRNKKPKASLKVTYGLPILVALLALMNALLIFGIVFSSKGVMGYRQQHQMVLDLEKRLGKLKGENQKVFKNLQDLGNSPETQERIIRKQLGWARDGELVFEFDAPETDKK